MNFTPGGGNDFTVTSRQSSTWTQQHRQVPVAGTSNSGVEGFHSEPRPDATSAGGVRRAQSSTAVYRHGPAADPDWQNGSMVGTYRLGSTYDVGDYDPVDSMRAGTVTTSLQRQHHQTSSSSPSPAAYTLPPQRNQLTGVVRGHRRTHSTGLAETDRRPPAQVAYNNGSLSRTRVETEPIGGLENYNQQAGYRIEESQQSGTRRQGDSGNVMVVSNAGYEPTTLKHETPPTVVQNRTVPVVVVSRSSNASTSPRLNGDSGSHQSSARYDQRTSVVRQQVQPLSYVTVHRVQQPTSPGSSTFQRAVIVDASELISQPQQQTGKQLDIMEQQHQRQHEMLLRKQEEERQRLMTRQQREQRVQTQRQSDVDQHQVMMRQRQQAVAQNVAANPSRNTPDRPTVHQVGDNDGQSRFKSSTVTTTTSAFERTATRLMGNGHTRSDDLPALRPVQAVDRRQSPANFSNSSGGFLQSGGGDGRSTTISADNYTIKRSELVSSGGRGDVVVPVVRRGGGADTPTSMSSAASRHSQTSGGTQQRSSIASSSATEQSSVELGDESSLGRASSLAGERRILFHAF